MIKDEEYTVSDPTTGEIVWTNDLLHGTTRPEAERYLIERINRIESLSKQYEDQAKDLRAVLFDMLAEEATGYEVEADGLTAKIEGGYSYHQYHAKSIDEVLQWLTIIRQTLKDDDYQIRDIIIGLQQRIENTRYYITNSEHVVIRKKGRGHGTKLPK